MVITRSDAVGGAQIHVRDLAVALRARGHRVGVWVGGRGPFVAMLQRCGVPVRSLSHLVAPIAPRADVRAAVELRGQLRAFAPDVVTLHSAKAGVLGRLAARGLGAAVIYTVHGWSFVKGVPAGRAAIYQLVERLAAPLADRIIAVSEHDRRLAHRVGVGRGTAVVCVPNGIPDVDPSLRASPDALPVRLVVVARLDVPKDPFTLLRALESLRGRAWTLEWVGDGPRRVPAERLAAALGLASRCRFVGARSDVPQRLARASALVLCSAREGLPLCVLEGMRAGLPVIASAVGGIPEAVDDGITGILVPPGDPQALSRALGSLLDDPVRRVRLGAAGRARYEARFTFDRQYQDTLDVYRSACGRGPDPHPRRHDVRT